MENIRNKTLPESLIPVSCNRDCGGGCPLVAEMKNGRPVRILDNPLRPDPQIKGCTRGYRALDSALSSDRLTTPLKRRGDRGSGDFVPMSWDDVLDEIAGKLEKLKTDYGTESLMYLAGSGSCRGMIHTTSGLTQRFFSRWGKTTTTSGYYSNTAAMFATQSVYGMKRAGRDPDTLRGSGLVILWGANICDMRFGAKLEPVLRDLKKEGVPFYVIDPRLTRTGKVFADGSPDTMNDDDSRWLAVKPGTDPALMAAVLYQLLKNDQVDWGFIDRYTSGFKDLEEWVRGNTDGIPKNPEWAAGICGLTPGQIQNLAAAFGRANPAALIPGLSIQRTLGGEEAYRRAMALQAARGNVGIPGGSSGGCLWDTMPAPKIGTVRNAGWIPGITEQITSRTGEAGEKVPPVFKPLTVPVNNWQDAVLRGRDGGWPSDIRGIYAVGNNYILQSSDQSKTRDAFSRSDISVCHDLFMTGTALWSDYVLPATHFLERDDIVCSGENYLYFSKKILEAPGEARDDYDIFLDLARRLGIEESFGAGMTSGEWLHACLDESEIYDPKDFKSTGIYDPQDHNRILLEDFISDPGSAPLDTPDGLINFSCRDNARYGFPAHPHYRETAGDLRMITPHARLRINSQFSNLPWFKEREFPLFHMNPEDAADRGIEEGMIVRIRSTEGEIELPVTLSGEVRPGIVWALQGSWEIETSVNKLTSTESTLPSFGSRTHSIIVQVSAAGGSGAD